MMVQAGDKAGIINVEAKTKKLKGTISIKVKQQITKKCKNKNIKYMA